MKLRFTTALATMIAGAVCFGQRSVAELSPNGDVLIAFGHKPKPKIEEPEYPGLFYTATVVVSNSPSMSRPTGYDHEWLVVTCATNWIYSGALMIDEYGMPIRQPCQREHIDDGKIHEDVTYNQRNMMAYLVWNGKTNSFCLSSECIATNVNKWKWVSYKKEVK